jgi:tetratricopeptide (TPR) repeat protein
MCRFIYKCNALLLSLCLSLMLGGCGIRQRQAQSAYERYQSAAAAGDLPASQRALLELVGIDDSQAQYWTELGKVSLQMSDYGAAFNAFTRAHELDRANPVVLDVLTQVALRTGNLELAEQYARQLELVSPNHPSVRLTYGYVALRRRDFERADEQATLLLAEAPFDGSAKVLRARILLGQQKYDDAVRLLEAQVRLQPSDTQSLKALLSLYELKDRWSEAAIVGRKLVAAVPKDHELRARSIEAQLRSGDTTNASTDTVVGLRQANSVQIGKLLAPWIETGKTALIAEQVGDHAREVEGDRRIALSRFLILAKQPQRIMALVQSAATLPVTPANATANALHGAALIQLGKEREGSAKLDQVLRVDNQQPDALAARAKFMSQKGHHAEAVKDAQKLVAIDATNPNSRLLLARVYLAARDTAGARRALWEAFNDLPVERSVYETLRDVLQRLDEPSVVERLSKEHHERRTANIMRSFS